MFSISYPNLFLGKILNYDSETKLIMQILLYVAQRWMYKSCFTSLGEFVVYTNLTSTASERVEN